MTAVCLGVPTSRFERKLVEKIAKVQKDEETSSSPLSASTHHADQPPGLITPTTANRLYQMDFGAAFAAGAFPSATTHTASATRGAAALLDIFDRSIVRQKHNYFTNKEDLPDALSRPHSTITPYQPTQHVPRYDRSLRLGKGTFGEVVLAEDTHQTAINIAETIATRKSLPTMKYGDNNNLAAVDVGLNEDVGSGSLVKNNNGNSDSVVGEDLEAHREYVAIKTLKKDVINNMLRISPKLASATSSATPTDPSSLILCLSSSPPLVPSTTILASSNNGGPSSTSIVTNTKSAAIVLRVPNTRRFDYASTNSVTFKNIKKQLVGMRGTVVNELKMMQLAAHPNIISLLDVRLRIFTTDPTTTPDGKPAAPEKTSPSRRQKEVIAPPPKDSVQLDFIFPVLTADLSELCKSNALQVKNAIIVGREASRDAGAFQMAKGESVEKIQSWINSRSAAPLDHDIGTPKGKRSRSPHRIAGGFAESDSAAIISSDDSSSTRIPPTATTTVSGDGAAEQDSTNINDEADMRSLYGSCIALQHLLQPQNVSIRGNTTINSNPPIVAGANKSPDAPAASSSAYLSGECAITMRQLHYLLQESFCIDRQKVLRRLTEVVAKDLSAALDHLHNRRVIHRDLKSNNVLLAWRGPKATGKWVVQLVDFGWTRTAISTDENFVNNKHLQYDLEEAVCLATVAVDGAEITSTATISQPVPLDSSAAGGRGGAMMTILSPLNSLAAILNTRASDAPIRHGHPFYGQTSAEQQTTLRMLVSHVARQSYLNALRWRATQIAQWSAACGATDLTGPCCNNRYKAPELLASNVERTRPSRTLQRHFDRSIVVEWGLCSLAEHGSAIIHSDLLQAAETPSTIANNLRYLKDFIAKARRLCTHTQSTIPPLVITHADNVSEPSLPTTNTTSQMVCGLPPAAAEHLAAPDLLDRIRKKSEPYYPFLATFLEGDASAVAQQLSTDPNDQEALALNTKLKRVVELSSNAWTSVINKRDSARDKGKRRLGEDPLSDNDSEEDEEEESLEDSDDLESMRRTSDDVETAINECNFNKTTVYGQGHYYSTKIDMWSLGCVLLDVVTSCGSSLQRLEHTVFGIYGDNFKHWVTGTYDTKFLQQMGGSRSSIQRRFASQQQQSGGGKNGVAGAAFGIVNMWNSMSGATAISPHAHDDISENERISLTNALAKRYNNTAGYCDGAGSLGTHTTTVSEYDDSLSDFDDSEGGGKVAAANQAPKKKAGKPGNNDSGQKYKQHPSVFRFALNAVGIPRSYVEEAIACIFSINFAVPTIPADLTELMPLHQEDHVRHAYQDPPAPTAADGTPSNTAATATAVAIPVLPGSPGKTGAALAPPVANLNATRQHFMASSSIVNPWSVVPLANERCQRTATRFIKSLAYDILTAIIHHCGNQAHDIREGELSLDEQMLRYVRQLKKVFLSDPPAAVAHVRQLLKNVATEYNRRQSLAHVHKHLSVANAGQNRAPVPSSTRANRGGSPLTATATTPNGPTLAASIEALNGSLRLLDHYAPHDAAVLYIAPNLLHSSPLWLCGGFFDAVNCASPAPGRLPGLSHRDRYLNASASPYTQQLIKSNAAQLEWTKTNHNDGLLDSVEQFIQCGQHKHLSLNKVFLRGAPPPAQSTTMTAIIAQAQAHASPRTASTPTSPNGSAASTPLPGGGQQQQVGAGGLSMPSLVFGESLIKHIMTGEASLHVTAAPSFGVVYKEGQCASSSAVPDHSSYAAKMAIVEDRARHESLLFGLFSGLLAFDPQERSSAADALRSINQLSPSPTSSEDRLAFTDIVQLAGGRHLVMKMGK